MWIMWRITSPARHTNETKKMNNRMTSDVYDIVQSVLSLKLKTSVWLATVLGSFSVGSAMTFIDNWVFTPSVSFVALIAIILMDHLTGMYRAYKNNAFETKKAVRIFWTLLSHSSLLMLSFNLSKNSEMYVYVTNGIFATLVSVNFLSMIKNMSLLGWIPKELANWLYKKIDVYKNEMDQNSKDSGNNIDGGNS
jgi:Bacteriophage holin family